MRQEFSENTAQLKRLAERTAGSEDALLRLDNGHFRTGEAGKWKARFLKVVAKVIPALKGRVDYTLKELENKTLQQRSAAVRHLGYMIQNSVRPDDSVTSKDSKVVTVKEAASFIEAHSTTRETAARNTWVIPVTVKDNWRAYMTGRDKKIDPLRIEDNLELEYAVVTDPEVVASKLQHEMKAADNQQKTENQLLEEAKQKIKQGEDIKDFKIRAAVEFDKLADERWGKASDERISDIAGLKQGRIELEPFEVKDGDVRERASEFHTEAQTSTGVAHCEGRRKEMEDEVLCTTFRIKTREGTKTIKLTGVFDGHGGDVAARHAKTNLVRFLKKRLQEGNPRSLDDTRMMNALKLAFVDASNSYKPPADQPISGTTANVVLQVGDDLWTANLGDARAVLIAPDGGVKQLSEDAKPDDKKYQKGIEKRGGEAYQAMSGAWRVSGGSAVARSMGDHYSYGAISARPKVTKLTRPAAGWAGFKLVQACDGLFDVATSETVGKVVTNALGKEDMTNAAIAAHLAELAYKAGSQDNVSVTVTSVTST
ncbi:hypothetical protein GZ77_02080 [Endozoicomonas montiporae]|uniref:PPM-type phosphatase domain-containing protein n=1 Tax=Endozoicomonas montiporae TaxID=1027273 RepID=A0A081NAI3_9GAMM|nr:hypothetical protein GZ77_02080 [Endozoicomonas montiporae]